MTIADTIKSLKPGDRVRVTREQEVAAVSVSQPLGVSMEDGPIIWEADPTITSIEVIERPLQVGDRVTWDGSGFSATITAMDDTYAILHRDGWTEKVARRLSGLRRAS